MARPDFVSASIGLAVLILSAGLLVSDAQAANAKENVPGEDGCYKKIGVKGRPHKLTTVASLSAVRQWAQVATKHGDAFSMWHNASGSTIKCEKMPRSDYYSCFASGKPCPAREISGAVKPN